VSRYHTLNNSPCKSSYLGQGRSSHRKRSSSSGCSVYARTAASASTRIEVRCLCGWELGVADLEFGFSWCGDAGASTFAITAHLYVRHIEEGEYITRRRILLPSSIMQRPSSHITTATAGLGAPKTLCCPNPQASSLQWTAQVAEHFSYNQLNVRTQSNEQSSQVSPED
jgi:hypothetical protein